MNITSILGRATRRMRVIPFERRFVDQVLELARAMHAESVFHRDIPLDEAKLIQQIEAGSALPHVYFRLCVRDDEVVLGGFFGTISSIYFSTERVAKDLAWFVRPTARGSAAAVALLADFEAWAAERGVQHVMVGQSTGVRPETTKALYERLGYRAVGVNTVKRVA